MTARRGVRIGGFLAALVLTLALAGCGDDGDDGSPSDGATAPSAPAPHLPPFELPPEFRDCMADEGIDIPASGDLPADVDPVQFDRALRACAELLHP
ncbi:MAG: hypothetical protein ACRDZ1_06575 [Acidimicrobiia bacterium]